tara:strand:+ start:37344 stop:37952 length:609 start_codon:yes stop_codon:yes gene_type:complete
MTLQFLWTKILKKLRGSAIKNSTIHTSSKVEAGSNVVNTHMDKHSFCGYNCEIVNCEIGSFVSIANGVIIGGGMHPISWVGMSPVFYKGRDSVKAKFSVHEREEIKKTIIGHDVWIGQNVLIKQGVNIGTGAVVGMGSVVTKDIPPYAIYGGNPAKLIKMRFDNNLCNDLLRSEWWMLPEHKLEKYAVFFKDPIQFLNIINS